MYHLSSRLPSTGRLHAHFNSRSAHTLSTAHSTYHAAVRRHVCVRKRRLAPAACTAEPQKSATAPLSVPESAAASIGVASADAQVLQGALESGAVLDTNFGNSHPSESTATAHGEQCQQNHAEDQTTADTAQAASPAPEYVVFTAAELQSEAPPGTTCTAQAEAQVPLSDNSSDTTSPSDCGKSSSTILKADAASTSGNAAVNDSTASDTAALDATTSSSAVAEEQSQGKATEQLQHDDTAAKQQTPEPPLCSTAAEQQQDSSAVVEQEAAQPAPASWIVPQKDATDVPPPLIDPTVDIANDPAYAIRLLDILDQISVSSGSSSSSSASSSLQLTETSTDTTAGRVQQPSTDSKYKFVRQPAAFCTNCCTPLDPIRPAAACSACGHYATDDHLLFSHGVSSLSDLSNCRAPAGAAAAAAGAASSAEASTKLIAQRIEAGLALQQARQLLQAAGILQLPTTMLAWEDDQTDPEPAMQLHRAMLPPNHERPERMQVLLARLRAAGLLDICSRLQPREATEDELLAVHSPGLIHAVAALSHANQPSDLNQVAAHLAPDMLGNRYTYRAARTAAGTAAELARQLVTGQASNGMALIRPMGHSAGFDSGEAGNYFNNIAVAVRAAQRAGARRVMVIDWDVHHCKGTSEIFAEDPNVLVFSLHRYGSGFYPSTGAAEDVGFGRGRGRNINVAWCPPMVMDKRGRRVQVEAAPISDGDYLTAWHMLVLPVAAEFRPDVILVSAGFDAADKDPLGRYRVHPELFGHLTALLRPLAPLGLLLEGGYNLAVTAACAEACIKALLGEKPAPLRGSRCAGVTGWASILRTLLVQQEHWQCLGMLNFIQLATPVVEDWEDREVDQEEEDEEYEYEREDEAEDEQELQETEVQEALVEAISPSASVSVDDFEPEQVVAAISEAPDLMQQVLELLDQKIAAAKQKELDEALKAAALDAAAAAAEQQQDDATLAAAEASRSSSSWSAGGFMDDVESVDSGSESDDNISRYLHPSTRTDWGVEQIDEDVYEHLPWYGAKDTHQQLQDAQEAAAATAAAATAVVSEAAVSTAAAAAAAAVVDGTAAVTPVADDASFEPVAATTSAAAVDAEVAAQDAHQQLQEAREAAMPAAANAASAEATVPTAVVERAAAAAVRTADDSGYEAIGKAAATAASATAIPTSSFTAPAAVPTAARSSTALSFGGRAAAESAADDTSSAAAASSTAADDDSDEDSDSD